MFDLVIVKERASGESLPLHITDRIWALIESAHTPENVGKRNVFITDHTESMLPNCFNVFVEKDMTLESVLKKWEPSPAYDRICVGGSGKLITEALAHPDISLIHVTSFAKTPLFVLDTLGPVPNLDAYPVLWSKTTLGNVQHFTLDGK